MTVISAAPVRPVARPRPLERVEAELVTLATQLTAATARFITLVGEFDAAEGWRDWAMRSTAHWLSWKCGVGITAAREQVRVARALRGLPVVAAAFADARLSYSKVRALSRFATPDNEADVVAIAECATAAQMEALQAGMRRARTADDVRRRHAARYFTCRVDDDGSVIGTFWLAPEQAAVFLRGLETARGRLALMVSDGDDASAGASPTGPPTQPAESRTAADALVAMAERTLRDASAEASGDAAERIQLVLHSTVEALAADDDADDHGSGSELADGTRLHPATARRLTCNCPTSTMLDDTDGSPLHLGRRHRRIRGRMLRAVHARDRGRCRAPAYTQPASQIHHIRHWANGGPTCLPNLISLCDHHHWTVHEGGFTVLTRRPGQWALLGPTGVTIDPTPPAPGPTEPLRHDPALHDDAVSGTWDGTRLDVAYTIHLLNEHTEPTPPPPAGPPAQPAQPAPTAPRHASAEAFDLDTVNRWLDNVRAMQQGAATSPHITYITDEDDAPYT